MRLQLIIIPEMFRLGFHQQSCVAGVPPGPLKWQMSMCGNLVDIIIVHFNFIACSLFDYGLVWSQLDLVQSRGSSFDLVQSRLFVGVVPTYCGWSMLLVCVYSAGG